MMGRMASWIIPLCVVGCVACSQRVDLDDVPDGADVQVVRQDGALVEGRVVEHTDQTLKVDVGRATPAEVDRAEIADLAVVEPDAPMPPPPAAATFREVSVPAGTDLKLELGTALDTGANGVGDPVTATLSQPVSVGGVDVLPAGATLGGRVTSVVASGRVKGRARLGVEFSEITVRDETYPLAAGFELEAPSTASKDAKTIGIPAAGGAVLGAILGGKKGAAVGAAIGGGAGTGAVLMTAGEEIRLGHGAALSVSTEGPITVKVPIARE